MSNMREEFETWWALQGEPSKADKYLALAAWDAAVQKLKSENEKLRADNSSKNGQLKAFGKQVSTLGRTIRNRDRRLAKLEPKP